MIWAAVWVLAAAAWLAPADRRGPPHGTGPAAAAGSARAARSRAGQRRIPLWGLRSGVALATAMACVAAFGLRHGALASCALVPASVHLVSTLARRPTRSVPDRALALTLDLLAAALRSGLPVAAALALAAPAAGPERQADLARVAALLRWGADPEEAWRSVAHDTVLAPVGQAACRSAHSGIRLAQGFELVGDDIRGQVRAAAEARAHRAGVLAMAPLGLCFLPAFVCLGVAPVVISMAAGVFGGLA